jgi:hypothetical protein
VQQTHHEHEVNDMQGRLLAAAAILLAATVIVPAANAAAIDDGPRPSSLNNWPGIRKAPVAAQSSAATAAAPPHYEWIEGYSHHGRWVGQWELVR